MGDLAQTRAAIIEACVAMEARGITHGTSGNVSVRAGDGLLITPSAVPYAQMTPEMICYVPLVGEPVENNGQKPSTEWRFHQEILRNRADLNAVVHAHPAYATAVSCQRRGIPAVHYMVAAFGGAQVPVTGYALFGSAELATMVGAVMRERAGCLLANHGAVTGAATLAKALWLMEELENLARVFVLSESSGTPVILSDAEITEALEAFGDYGLKG